MRYYRQEEGDRKTVPELLAQMRRQVLGRSTLVLSGLVPLHKKTVGANAPRPPIVRYAQSLGSRVSVRLGFEITDHGAFSALRILTRSYF